VRLRRSRGCTACWRRSARRGRRWARPAPCGPRRRSGPGSISSMLSIQANRASLLVRAGRIWIRLQHTCRQPPGRGRPRIRGSPGRSGVGWSWRPTRFWLTYWAQGALRVSVAWLHHGALKSMPSPRVATSQLTDRPCHRTRGLAHNPHIRKPRRILLCATSVHSAATPKARNKADLSPLCGWTYCGKSRYARARQRTSRLLSSCGGIATRTAE
jgi:hypothetical protein